MEPAAIPGLTNEVADYIVAFDILQIPPVAANQFRQTRMHQAGAGLVIDEEIAIIAKGHVVENLFDPGLSRGAAVRFALVDMPYRCLRQRDVIADLGLAGLQYTGFQGGEFGAHQAVSLKRNHQPAQP